MGNQLQQPLEWYSKWNNHWYSFQFIKYEISQYIQQKMSTWIYRKQDGLIYWYPLQKQQYKWEGINLGSVIIADCFLQLSAVHDRITICVCEITLQIHICQLNWDYKLLWTITLNYQAIKKYWLDFYPNWGTVGIYFYLNFIFNKVFSYLYINCWHVWFMWSINAW